MDPQAQSSDFAVQYRHALSLHQAGRLAEAEAAYQALVSRSPGHPLVLTGLGTIALQLGNVDEGIRQLGHSLQVEPNQPQTHCNLGIALWTVGRASDALACFDRAIALQPDLADAYSHRGVVLYAMSRLDEALASLDRAIALNPQDADAYSHRGVVLRGLGRRSEAMASFDRAIALNPAYAEAYYNRGKEREELRLLDQALADYDRAIALNPDYAEACNNRGNVLHELGRFHEAVESFDRAIALNPAYAEAYYNRGNALGNLRQLDQALADYDRAIALNPDYPEAYWNKSLLKLLLGEYEEGWKLYEWRWKTSEQSSPRNFPQPLWLGNQPIAGKTLLIHAEQGFGDFIQCCRYIPMAEAMGATVIVEVFPPLIPLLSTLKSRFSIVPSGRPLPHFDFHCPVMSLPLAFGTTVQTIPATVPYLFADPARLQVWRQRLGPRVRMRVGLTWSGNPAQKDNHHRSIPVRLLAPLLALPVEFHVLQKGIRPEDAAAIAGFGNVHVHEHEIGDFSDTAALVQEMDLVISMCTSVAHLTGAMGKPLWVLLSYTADWRWLLDRSDSPWYPSATLFRQPASGDWPSVIARVSRQLHNAAQEINARIHHGTAQHSPG